MLLESKYLEKIEILEPARIIDRMDKLDPNRVKSKTLAELPHLKKERTLNEEPKSTKSKVENAVPAKCAREKRLTVLARRVTLRKERTLPTWRKSCTVSVDDSLVKLLIDVLEPNSTKSNTDMHDPKFKLEKTLSREPRRT
jgi:hypothetical protein